MRTRNIKKVKNGHNSSPIPPMFILKTLYSSLVYALVSCKATAALIIAQLNAGGKNMITSLKTDQIGKYEVFPKKG